MAEQGLKIPQPQPLAQLGQFGRATLLDGARHAVGQPRGGRSRPRTEAEDVQFGEAHLGHRPARGRKILVALAGETDDHVGAQCGPVQGRRQLPATLDELPHRAATPHPLQDAVRSALHREVQVRADSPRIVGHRLDQRRRHLGVIEAGDANAELAVQFGDPAHQPGEDRQRGLAAVQAVMAEVNADQHDLAVTVAGQRGLRPARRPAHGCATPGGRWG